MAEVRIGTSGWSYRHWREGAFYPPGLKTGEQLEHYSRVFDCVELNSTFYHTPRDTTLAGWVARTPDGFLFAYKGSRAITHTRRLGDVAELVAFVLGRARLLGGKLGPVLWQLPPAFRCDLDRLAAFLDLLQTDLRHAFEFRHESWFQTETYALLQRHGAALVWADTPAFPLVKRATAPFLYLRLHGHERLYASCYTDDELAAWAAEVRAAVAAGLDCYIFFDNDAEGYAPRNAVTLRDMVAAFAGDGLPSPHGGDTKKRARVQGRTGRL